MSRITPESESNRLYTADATDDALLMKLLLEREKTQMAIDEIKARKVTRMHTLGTLNPGKRVGWGEAS